MLFRSLRPAHILRNIRNLPFIVYAHTHFKESGETLVYGIEAEGKQIVWEIAIQFALRKLLGRKGREASLYMIFGQGL